MKSPYEIRALRQWPSLAGEMARWFARKWRIPKAAYEASMAACLRGEAEIPQWYVIWLPDSGIVGGAGLIENDFHDRTDLTPNLCALYVEPEHRGQGMAGALLAWICRDARQLGFDRLYLVTDHTAFYERYGWEFLTMVNDPDGIPERMYTIAV